MRNNINDSKNSNNVHSTSATTSPSSSRRYASPSSTSSTSSASSSLLTFYLNPPSREVLSRRLAQRLMSDLALKPYQAIHLSGCALGDAAVGIAGPLLLNLATAQSLRAVYLSDIIATLMPDEALRSLSSLSTSIGVCKHLQTVSLSDNALGTRGLAACQQLIKSQPELRYLCLSNTGLSADSVRLLQDMLAPSPTPPDIALQTLILSGNRIENSGVKSVASVVAHAPQLRRLSLASVGADSAAITTLASALTETATQLRLLDLSDSSVDVQAATKLAEVLKKQPNLNTLSLADVDMGDEAAAIILKALLNDDESKESSSSTYVDEENSSVKLPPIQELNLSGNELTVASSDLIASVMCTHRATLEVLDLRRNELGDTGLAPITLAIKQSVASPRIALSSVRVCENGIQALALIRLAIAIVRLRRTCELYGRDNPISDNAYERFADILGNSFAGEDREDADVPEPPMDEGGDELQNAFVTLTDLVNVMREDEARKTEKVPSSSASVKSSTSSFSSYVRLFSKSASSKQENNKSQQDKSGPETRSESESSSSRRNQVPNLMVNNVTDTVALKATKNSSQEETSVIVEDGPEFNTPKRGKGAENNRLDIGAGKNRGGLDGFTISSTRPIVDGSNEQRSESPATPLTPAGNTMASSANFVESARKLRESLASLSKEISDVASELQMPVASPSPARSRLRASSGNLDESGENINDYLLVERNLTFEQERASALSFFFDVFGGLLVAVFVVILVLAIAQSQDENTFPYQRV